MIRPEDVPTNADAPDEPEPDESEPDESEPDESEPDESEPDESEPDDPVAALFDASRAHFVSPPASAGNSLFLFVTLLLFVFSAGPGASPTSIAVLVGVLVIHELGHYVGMRAFGYRDVRMFFVPFLGAAVSGRRGSVAAWKDAVVLLLGPVPGVFLGVATLLATARWPHPILVSLGETLLLVNAFNLLPFGGLDGGKLLLRVIFARHRYLELGFAALGAVGLGVLAFTLGSVALGFFALAGLASLPGRARVLAAATALSPALANASAASLDEGDTRKLFDAARTALPASLSGDPRAIGRAMEDMLLARQRPPGILASATLFGIWAITCVVAFVGAVVLAVALAPAEWERHSFADFSVELPGDPRQAEESWSTPGGQRLAHIEHTQLDIVERFTITVVDAGADIPAADLPAWRAAARAWADRDVGAQGASFVSERELVMSGQPAVDSTWRNGWRVWHVRTLIHGRRVFQLVASSPGDTANASRFLDSFELDSP